MSEPMLWACWVGAIGAALGLRGRFYAVFVAVFFGVAALCLGGLLDAVPAWARVAGLPFLAATTLHFVVLSRPALRPTWYRALVSIPGLWFVGAAILAWPWSLAGTLTGRAPGWWIPFAVSLLGVVQSLRNPWSEVDLVLDRSDAGPLGRLAGSPSGDQQAPDPTGPPLRIAQITDPHIGPFMSPARLRAVVERAVAADPDLVLITGDLLTMESHRAVDAVRYAFEPLHALPGRVFGCFGNHDHEARATVRAAFASVGAELLVDELRTVETRVGPVEVVGADWRFRDRIAHVEALFDAVGLRGETPRLLLLHDPGGFAHLPDGAADLTLAGHTHGGHVGLVSLGLDSTVVSLASRMPDHGLWGRGTNRLYVHRGTGHYGFPFRLGVPGEEGILNVWFA